jgi:hypothetical protein
MPEKAFGRFTVTSRLNQDVEHDAVLIDGSRQTTLYALDLDGHLIKLPLVARPRTSATHAVGKALAKLLVPASKVSSETMIPRSASRSATARKLRLNT